MSFWIKVDVEPTGIVVAKTYSDAAGAYNGLGRPYGNALRARRAATVSQVLRLLAASMVHSKAELTGMQS